MAADTLIRWILDEQNIEDESALIPITFIAYAAFLFYQLHRS